MSSYEQEGEAQTPQNRGYICSFVPEYVLEAISQSTSAKVDDSCRSCAETSISAARAYHDQRGSPGLISQDSTTQSQQTLSGGKKEVVERIVYDSAQSERLPGRLARSEGQERTDDRQVGNCYDGIGIVSNFFRDVLGRKSLDGKGMNLIASCHYRENGLPLNNAFWTSPQKQIVFGDGDGVVFDYLTDSLDIIAHELTHGLIDHTAQLVYRNQSGALNESCADVFACMIEQWHQNTTVDQADWVLGQTMFPVSFRGLALRSVKNPGSAYENHEVLGDDIQPKHMDNLYRGESDLGGVHINSGIPNYAFYLAAKEVGGYVWEKIGLVWYTSLLQPRDKIPMNCDFKQFAELTVEVAGTLFSKDVSVKEAIRKAWISVGVLRVNAGR